MKIKKFQNGDKVKYPYEKEVKQWTLDWLSNRKNILENNIEDANKTEGNTGLLDKFINFVKNPRSNSNINLDKQLQNASSANHYLDLKSDSNIEGEYSSLFHNVYYYKDIFPEQMKSVGVHETTHSLKAGPQNKKILEIIPESNDLTPRLYKDQDDYIDNVDEIYARLMQFRYDNNLDPNKQYTLRDIKRFKENAAYTHSYYYKTDKPRHHTTLKPNLSNKNQWILESPLGDSTHINRSKITPEKEGFKKAVYDPGILFRYTNEQILRLLNEVAVNK